MSLGLLVIMVVFGIGAIVAAVHLTGGSRRACLDGEDAARLRFAEDFPSEKAEAVHITADAAAAFLVLDGHRVGIVYAVGNRFLTRIVTRDDLAGAPTLRGGEMVVTFRDFTWPGATFTFAGAGEANHVAALLAGERTREEA